MIDNTLKAFKDWNKITDYESDETSVDLKNGDQIVASFNYHKFTREDFEYFKKSTIKQK